MRSLIRAAPGCALLALVLVLTWAGTSRAATTITVNTTTDAAPAGGECSGGPTDCSLRQAIDKAATGDTIVVPSNATHYAVSISELAVAKTITIAGAGAPNSIIDAAAASQGRRIFHVTGAGNTLTLTGLTLTGGFGPDDPNGGGGAVFTDTGGFVRVIDSLVTGNRARGTGGAIGSVGGGFEITRSLVTGNQTPSGNGGAVGADGGADSTITNSTIRSNTAQNVGGGVEVAGLTLSIVNSTITGNSATSSGGGIYRSNGGPPFGSITLRNTIIAGNTSGIAGQGNCVGVDFANPTSLGHNLEDTDTCGLNQPGDLKNATSLLGPLQDNGGPTATQALLPGSPAIDAGDNTGCPASDQRGALRPGGSACDIGAFELATPRATTAAASGVGALAATLNGEAGNPDFAAGTAFFEYGTSTSYGKVTPAGPLAALQPPAPFSAAVGGLIPSTAYHFRLVASNGVGTVRGTDQTFTTGPVISRLSRLRIAPSAFPAAGGGGSVVAAARKRRTGAVVSYTASQPATTRFTVQRKVAGRRQAGRCRKPTKRNRRGRSCKRWVRVGKSFTQPAKEGANRFRFTGRVSGRKLKPRRYRLRAVPVNGAGTGGAVNRAFRIKR